MRENFTEPLEEIITRALPRLSYIDSHRLIELAVDYLPDIANYTINQFDGVQQRMWQMLQFTIWQKSYEECGFTDLLDGFRQIAASPVMMHEIIELLYYKYDQIDFVDDPVQVDFDCPLDVHCSYTRDQILVALDFMKPSSLREGVKYLEDKKTDLLFVTLNKSDKDYSPTTMYHDYLAFHFRSKRINFVFRDRDAFNAVVLRCTSQRISAQADRFLPLRRILPDGITILHMLQTPLHGLLS